MQETAKDMEGVANTVIQRLQGQLAEGKASEAKYEEVRKGEVQKLREIEEEEKRVRMEVDLVSKEARTLRELLETTKKEAAVSRELAAEKEEEGRKAREEVEAAVGNVAELKRELERVGEEARRSAHVSWIETSTEVNRSCLLPSPLCQKRVWFSSSVSLFVFTSSCSWCCIG